MELKSASEIVDSLVDWNARFRHVYNNKDLDFCDVTFSVGETIIRASRYVLGLRSYVFKTMFFGAFSLSFGSIVKINDVDADVFQLLIQYIYTDEAVLTGDNVLAAIYVAKKYGIQGLELMAMNFLENNITSDNVCTILTAANFYERADIEMKCIRIIDTETKNVISSDDFTSLSYENVLMIAKRDELNLDGEEQLFDAVMRWSVEECKRRELTDTVLNKRRVLGDILFEIRFPTMDPDLFVQGQAASGVLSDKEQLNVLKFHLNQNMPYADSMFCVKQRSYTKAVVALLAVSVRNLDSLKWIEEPLKIENVTLLSGTSEEFKFDLYRCDKESCQKSRRNKGQGCCIELQVRNSVPLHSLKKTLCKNSWIEVVNANPRKSVRRVLEDDDRSCEWFVENIIQFETVMKSVSGFNHEGNLIVKVHLLLADNSHNTT